MSDVSETQAFAEEVARSFQAGKEKQEALLRRYTLVFGMLTKGNFRNDYGMVSGLHSVVLAYNEEIIRLIQNQPMADIVNCTKPILVKAVEEMMKDLQFSNLTMALPCLEELGRATADDYGLSFISCNQTIADECQKRKLRCVGLIGTAWDIRSKSHLVKLLERNDMHVVLPDGVGVPELLTHCVYYEVRGGIYYQQQSYSCERFCLSVIGKMVERDGIDGLVLCNGELCYFEQKIKQEFPKLEIINAMPLHWQTIRDFAALSKT